MTGSSVAILADDLIWATRLEGQLRTLGATTTRVRDLATLRTVLDAESPIRPDRVVVDLTARAYDGLTAVGLAVEAGRGVLCVGQHDDVELRRRALAAGADNVYAYRALFERGHAVLAGWLGVPVPEPGSLVAPDR